MASPLQYLPPANFSPWSLPFGRWERYQQKCTSNLNFMSKHCKLLQNIENSVSLKYISLSSVPPGLSLSLHCTQHCSWCLNCFPICSIAIYAVQFMHDKSICIACIALRCPACIAIMHCDKNQSGFLCIILLYTCHSAFIVFHYASIARCLKLHCFACVLMYCVRFDKICWLC